MRISLSYECAADEAVLLVLIPGWPRVTRYSPTANNLLQARYHERLTVVSPYLG